MWDECRTGVGKSLNSERQRTGKGPCTWGWVAALTLAGVALRSWDLGQESLWLDELSALAVAQQSWAGVKEHLALFDVHPPLYFALLKLWGGVFGFGETAVRSLSVLVGVIAIPSGAALAGALARRLGFDDARRRRAILCAAALLAASPFATYYAREARGYSLLLGVATLATWLLVRAVPGCPTRALILYGLACAALPYTHVFGLFTLAAHGVYVVAEYRFRGLDRRGALRLLVTQAIATIAYAPWVPVTLAQVRRVSKGFWVPRPAPFVWLKAWLAEGALSIIWVAATAALASIAIARLVRARDAAQPRTWPVAALLGAGLIVPSLLPIVLSTFMQPIFMSKYAIASAGLLLVCAALPLAELRARGATTFIVLLALVGACEAGRDVFLWRHKEDWRALCAFASAEARAGTPLAHTIRYHKYLRHYLDPAAPLWAVTEAELTTDGPETLAARLAAAGKDRFWMLNIHPGHDNPTLDPLLRRRWHPTARRSFFMAQAVLWVQNP